MTQPQCIQITTTVNNRDEAVRLGTAIVEKRLAACAQIEGPLASVYRWQGMIESTEEWRCVFKTRLDLYEQVEEEILRLHTYDTPQIVALPIVKGSTDYLKWIADQTL